MAYSIKKHEVDRLCNVLVVLGWTIEDENYGDRDITLKIRKELSVELLAAAGELDLPSSPG